MNKKTMRILVCGVLPPPCFGHSMLYEMLMRSLFSSEFEVSFLNMHFWSYATNKKVTGGKLFKMVKYYGQYLWRIAVFRPHYVLYNISFYRMPFLKDFLFCATGILLGQRMVLHDHGQYVQELYGSLPDWQKGLLRWMLKHSVASIVMGERVKPVYQGLMDQNKLLVVPGTVEDTRNIPVPRQEQKSGLDILYFSHMSRDKGIFVAFESLNLVLQSDKDVRWIFAGPIENELVMDRLKECQNAFPGRVSYLGYIDRDDERARIFRSADIFVFPTMRDVFGLVLLHAMAESLPIVASHEGTIPEILPDDQHGLLFEKGSARALAEHIQVLLKDPVRRRVMGGANRQRFEDVYCLEKYGDYMCEAFKHLTQRNAA